MKRCSLIGSIAAGVCILSLTMMGCSQFSSWNQARYERNASRQAPRGTNTAIDVQTRNGTITITGTEVDHFDVIAKITGFAPTDEEAQDLAEETQIRLESVGTTLRVRADSPTMGNNRGVSVSYTITTPRRMNVNCESHFGRLYVAGVEGTVTGKSDNGAVEAKDIQGPVNLRTSYGAINCSNITGQMTELKSDNGSITLVNIKSSAKIKTSFGSVTCRNFSDGDFHLRSDNGRITLAHGSVGECDVSSSFGAIGCDDVKGKTLKLSSNNGRLELAEVDTPTLTLTTSYGAIQGQHITTADITARSGNGSVSIACSQSCPDDLRAEIRSNFGSIDFAAPPHFAGRVHLATDYGSVRTALPVTMAGEIDKKSVTGTVGKGAGSIHLSSADGSIELR